jgi:hypothetical protein
MREREREREFVKHGIHVRRERERDFAKRGIHVRRGPWRAVYWLSVVH